jgi:prevent-host-death family protein
MAKVIDTQEVRDHLGDIINQAYYRGDEFLVQRRGKPLVAIIPYEVYERLRGQRDDAFKVLHDIWDANPTVDNAQVVEDVREAVAELRSEKQHKQPGA